MWDKPEKRIPIPIRAFGSRKCLTVDQVKEIASRGWAKTK